MAEGTTKRVRWIVCPVCEGDGDQPGYTDHLCVGCNGEGDIPWEHHVAALDAAERFERAERDAYLEQWVAS